MRTVTVYSRQGCHLCDEALAVIERVRARTEFALDVRDIEADERLHAAYLERIPVVAVDGRDLFEFFVDEEALRQALG